VSGKHNYFGQWYLLEIDKPIDEFIIDRSEVEQIRWFPKEELLKEIQNSPDDFLETMKRYVGLFCK